MAGDGRRPYRQHLGARGEALAADWYVAAGYDVVARNWRCREGELDLVVARPGDTVRVHVRVVEGSKERIQVFQGVVIARSGSGIRETFKVRKVSYGVGVERTFPLHTPTIARIEVVSRGDVRRAKLYYLRDRIGKAAKIREKREA